MIREYKIDRKTDKSLDKHFIRSLVKADARKKNKQGKQGQHGKQVGKYSKKTKKNIQQGGNITKQKDKFEVTTLDNIDPSKYSLSQYVNSNIQWGIMPGPPPVEGSIM
jgi:hypothetical protein